MSIPFDSAFPGTGSELESIPEDVERQPNANGTFGNSESSLGGIAPQATRYAMSIVRVWADAEEVVQEAFCRLLQSDRFSTNSDRVTDGLDKALLFTTVRNLAIDQLRKQKRRRFEPMDVGQIPNAKVHSDESRLQQLELGVQAILKDLPTQWSDALQLKINGGLSYSEIADVLKATHAQVRTWIYRARKQLEKELYEQGLLNRGIHD
jgi:RNA polymerase sigma-70 factor (ECF subfamily)